MASPAPSGERPGQGLTKFIRRASKALRPRSNRNSLSGSFDTSAAGPSSAPVVVASAPAATAAVAAGAGTSQSDADPAEPRVDVEPRVLARTPLMLSLEPMKSAATYNKLREDKARAMFSKYGMTLRPGDWTRPQAATAPGLRGAATATTAGTSPEWVEKKILMRIHRTCHRCQTAFSTEKICNNCNHTRCKKCPRFPTKRPKEQRKQIEDPALAIAIDPQHHIKARIPVISAGTTKDGRDLVRRHPVQRVRRTCHRCDTLFAGKALQCENCKHNRCPSCPRDPPKLKKHDGGYPGDVEETFPLAKRTIKTPRMRYRWECHECNRAFIEHERTCRSCQHERCADCPRKPPKKTKKQPHPDVVASVEQKLAQLALGPET